MSIILPEKLKLRTESLTELTHLELDQNFQYVANPWSPLRKYKEGMIVYVAEEDISVTGAVTGSDNYSLSWWKARVNVGPSTIFDISKWDPIGAQAVTGEISVKDDSSSLLPSRAILLDFGNNLEVTMLGNTARIDVASGVTTPWQLITGSNEIYYSDNVLIGTTSAINTSKLQVVGNTWISGNLLLGGTVDGIDLAFFKSKYDSHKHYISNIISSTDNLSQISDIQITGLENTHILQYDSSLQRWKNTSIPIGVHSINQHSDVVLSSIYNNQILLYNGSNWINTSIVSNSSTGLSSPFSHTHDSRYYTIGQLGTSGLSSIHWDNITNAPIGAPDDEPYLLVSSPVGTSLSDYRILDSDSTIIISDSGAAGNLSLGVIDRTSIQKVTVEHNSISQGNHSYLDFVDTSSVIFNINQTTATDNIEISANIPGISNITSALSNATFLTLTASSNLSAERVLTAGSGISLIDSGAGSSLTVNQIPDSIRQKITASLNGINIGTSQPIFNFIEGAYTDIIITEDLINTKYDITLNIDPPITSVSGKTGDVLLRLDSDLGDVSIIPSELNTGGYLSPGTDGIYPNVLIWDGINLAWVNRPADELFAIAGSLSLDSLIDVEINTTGSSAINNDILYFDFATQLWVNGQPSDANLYSQTDLLSGALDSLYYTKSQLSSSSVASYVHWNKVYGYPTFALESQIKDNMYELLDVKNYSTSLPTDGQVLLWNASGNYWEPSDNIPINTFIDLQDVTPTTYIGYEGYGIRINSIGTGLEFFEVIADNIIELTDGHLSYNGNTISYLDDLNTGLDLKQDINEPTLNTTDKTIPGAINEIYNVIGTSSTKLYYTNFDIAIETTDDILTISSSGGTAGTPRLKITEDNTYLYGYQGTSFLESNILGNYIKSQDGNDKIKIHDNYIYLYYPIGNRCIDINDDRLYFNHPNSTTFIELYNDKLSLYGSSYIFLKHNTDGIREIYGYNEGSFLESSSIGNYIKYPDGNNFIELESGYTGINNYNTINNPGLIWDENNSTFDLYQNYGNKLISIDYDDTTWQMFDRNGTTPLILSSDGSIIIYGNGSRCLLANEDEVYLGELLGPQLYLNEIFAKWNNLPSITTGSEIINFYVKESITNNFVEVTNEEVISSLNVYTKDSSLIPDANDTYDLGSSTNKFKDLYLSGSTIYIGSDISVRRNIDGSIGFWDNIGSTSIDVKSGNNRFITEADVELNTLSLLSENTAGILIYDGNEVSMQSTLESHTVDSTIHYTQDSISIPANQINDFDTEVSNNVDVIANTTARHEHDNKDELDKIGENTAGDLTYNGQEIATNTYKFISGFFNNSTTSELVLTSPGSCIMPTSFDNIARFSTLYENKRNIFSAIQNSNEVVIPETGTYRIVLHSTINRPSGSGVFGVLLLDASDNILLSVINRPSEADRPTTCSGEIDLDFTSGDVLRFGYFSTDSSSDIGIYPRPHANGFRIEKLNF